MSHRTRWIAAIGGGLIIAYLVARCGRRDEVRASASPPRRAGASSPTSPRLDVAVATSVTQVATTAGAAAIDQAVARTASIIALPPSPGGADGDRLPPAALAMDTQIALHTAVVAWQRDVEQLLARCRSRAPAVRAPATLTVFFAPQPRKASDREQALTARWVQLEPSARRRLAQADALDEIDACLDQARALPLRVALDGDAAAHQFPASAEQLSIEL